MDVVVLQSCDPYAYFDLWLESSATARALCRRSRAHYQALVGLKRGTRDWHASFNRIDMLAELLDQGFRGWALWIDADAWVQDVRFPLREYLQDKGEYAFIGALGAPADTLYWQMNNGVLFYNLAHPAARELIAAWLARLDAFELGEHDWRDAVQNDQSMFHDLLAARPHYAPFVRHEDRSLINSPHASFIRQALLVDNPDFDARLARVREACRAALADEPERGGAPVLEPRRLTDAPWRPPVPRRIRERVRDLLSIAPRPPRA